MLFVLPELILRQSRSRNVAANHVSHTMLVFPPVQRRRRGNNSPLFPAPAPYLQSSRGIVSSVFIAGDSCDKDTRDSQWRGQQERTSYFSLSLSLPRCLGRHLYSGIAHGVSSCRLQFSLLAPRWNLESRTCSRSGTSVIGAMWPRGEGGGGGGWGHGRVWGLTQNLFICTQPIVYFFCLISF